MTTNQRQALSVISVSHRNLAGLIRTEKSLQLLSGINFEWIVVDTGVCRETIEWLEGISRDYSFRYSCEPDEGIYDGMNKGIAMAEGGWLWFLNAGDIVSPNVNRQYLETLLPREDAALINFDFEIERDGNIYTRRSKGPDWIWYAMPTSHQAMWFRRDVISDGYNLLYPWAADHELTVRIYEAGLKIATVHDAVAMVEFEGTSRDNFDIYRYEVALINRRLLKIGAFQAFWLLVLQLFAGWCATRISRVYLAINPSRFFK